ncbi:DUF2807 domain-containing protein [Psychroflexus planctonicus]|uniref:DUF2807 domain-containing protein n=2 Tax=Psychroflexus planctonicus TaxID=1526575 RepID=A0ABQ1SIL5_9FLAO|nr:DUF2807 domain-containing protein [Psychroflexus planctonicus]
MMKNGIYLLLAVLFWACSPEAIGDCFTDKGEKEIQFFDVDTFEKISIRRNIALHITHAETQKVAIEADENILNGIDLKLVDGILDVEAQDLCPSGSKNPPYIVHLETPNLTEIRNASQYKVISTNQLNFDTLRLISENYNDSSALTVGDFELDLNLNQLHIIHAGISDFQLKGNTTRMNIGFYSGSGRIFAENLAAEEISIYHRGFADVHVYPVEKISGELRSTGNLILYNQPPIQNLETFFTGEILFNTE